jgi:glucosylceramidase
MHETKRKQAMKISNPISPGFYSKRPPATLGGVLLIYSLLANTCSAGGSTIYRSTCDRDFREVIGAVATPHTGPGASVIDLDAAHESHPWLGFGVSFPESSCHLIMRLSEDRRRALVESVFGKSGLGLSVGRVHMGSSDYSRHLYSYDDIPGDLSLERFSIVPDLAEVIPVIKMAKEANPDLFLFASPWSPPEWMKDNGSLCGGSLLESMEGVYAAYIEKFLSAYAAEGLDISAFTIQNEPLTRQNSDSPTCFMPGDQEARIAKLVSRRLAASGISAKPWLYDHNWDCVARVLSQLQEPELLSAIGGVAWHPYNGQPEDMAPIRARYPDLPMFMTEMGPHVDKRQRDIVWWADLAIRTINAGCRTFTSWCLALDEDGQPNVSRGFPCAGFVEIDSETGVTTPSSQFKAFRHFSPFVQRGAVVLDAPVVTGSAAIAPFPKDVLRSAAFRNPDGSHVVVFSYKGDDQFARKMVQIRRGGLYLPVQVFCGAVTTVVLDAAGATADEKDKSDNSQRKQQRKQS